MSDVRLTLIYKLYKQTGDFIHSQSILDWNNHKYLKWLRFCFCYLCLFLFVSTFFFFPDVGRLGSKIQIEGTPYKKNVAKSNKNVMPQFVLMFELILLIFFLLLIRYVFAACVHTTSWYLQVDVMSMTFIILVNLSQ